MFGRLIWGKLLNIRCVHGLLFEEDFVAIEMAGLVKLVRYFTAASDRNSWAFHQAGGLQVYCLSWWQLLFWWNSSLWLLHWEKSYSISPVVFLLIFPFSMVLLIIFLRSLSVMWNKNWLLTPHISLFRWLFRIWKMAISSQLKLTERNLVYKLPGISRIIV